MASVRGSQDINRTEEEETPEPEGRGWGCFVEAAYGLYNCNCKNAKCKGRVLLLSSDHLPSAMLISAFSAINIFA